LNPPPFAACHAPAKQTFAAFLNCAVARKVPVSWRSIIRDDDCGNARVTFVDVTGKLS